MKKIVLTSLLAVFAAGAASAAVTPYASLKLGYDSVAKADVEENGVKMAETPDMSGYMGSIAGGASFDVSSTVGLRAELEYVYADTEEDSSADAMTLSYSTVMVNGYADFGDASWVVKPYVGLGVGYAFGTVGSGSEDIDASGLAYGISAGVVYPIDSNFALDLGAKYTIHDLTTDEDSDVTLNVPAWSYMLGARYMF
ncbi:MAG TPA: outer membrane beta-barrel protein [Alphaproteobacteria bacterium]|nr:outer membrane beta-barrel protein [Alphaproteobacteria bacterium]